MRKASESPNFSQSLIVDKIPLEQDVKGTVQRPSPIRGGGGGYSYKVRIGVCREGSYTLTLFKDESNEN